MTTKTIPARTITTCDCCGVEMTGKNSRLDGGIKIKENGLDFQGMAVADASRSFDLCDDCLPKVKRAINDVFEAAATGESNV
ncbi:hypothetical protein ACTJK4_13945 [Ralstonia sp. 22111]|uniref:hypothetical protein n=1 Tax=Ralstonia sp. 22111 TaxID=3453878 RepID=UPI003F87E335